MADLGMVKPTDGIVSYGHPQVVTEGNVKTATNMYPARLVTRDTTDYDYKVCGADDTPLGWLGYEDTAPQFRPATPTTIYAAGNKAAVIRGGKFVLDYATLATSQTIVKGDALVPAADGTLQKAAAIAGVVPGTGSDTTPVTSTSAKPAITMTGDVGARRVVAYAEESVTTISTTATIKVRNNL